MKDEWAGEFILHPSAFILQFEECMIQDVIRDVQHRMHGAIEALHREFKTLRTGRANAAMLDGITVDYYGTPTPISQVASLKVPESSLIVAEPRSEEHTSELQSL